ncbi:MAG: acetylornithine/succinylornithine family transaminase [Ruminococcaceae bacterium]|nr:acetylornithine/succinylornithine family transaminase [Oscillospiraceae bacterium]
MDIKNVDSTYIANTYNRFPIQLCNGKGSLVYDENGKEYIDMGSGIAVNSFGFCDEEWQNAVTAQLSQIQHSSNLYYTEPCAKLAELICKKTGMSKVFFANSGAEANECAIKTARKYAAETKGSEFYTIITLKNSFHGRTLATLAATGQDVFHKDFLPLMPGFVYAQAGDTDELHRLVNENKCAAIMFECVQGEGGVIPLGKEYVDEIVKVAKENNLLVICDEVQTGNGRSGELYSYMHYGIKPDIFTTAKGLGGGLPIGAAVLGEKVKNTLTAGTHGSTFGGNPVCCAGALSILNRIDSRLLEDVKKKSEYIINSLCSAKGIESVTGLGLMLGIKTVKPASDVIKICMEGGVLCLSAKDKVRLLPALNIPWNLLEKAINVIKKAAE